MTIPTIPTQTILSELSGCRPTIPTASLEGDAVVGMVRTSSARGETKVNYRDGPTLRLPGQPQVPRQGQRI